MLRKIFKTSIYLERENVVTQPMPESLQIQGNSCKASNSRNKQTNAITKNKGSGILQTDLISAERKNLEAYIMPLWHYYVV